MKYEKIKKKLRIAVLHYKQIKILYKKNFKTGEMNIRKAESSFESVSTRIPHQVDHDGRFREEEFIVLFVPETTRR